MVEFGQVIYRRIVLAGSSCSGKSTLAKHIAATYGHRYIDIDYIHWLPNWVERDRDVKLRMVDEATQQSDWVIDGYSNFFRHLLTERADLILWLDTPMPRNLTRVITRTAKRARAGEVICNGNKESMLHIFDGKDSLFFFTLRTFRQRRKKIAAFLDSTTTPSHRFTSNKAALAWIEANLSPLSTVAPE